MAETMVLAELSIDASGVISGVAVTKESLGQLPPATEKVTTSAAKSATTMDLLTRRMFNLKGAVIALLGSFTLAGVIFQLGSLTKELITGTEAWKTWAGAAKDAFNAIVLGEKPLERIFRRLQDIGKGTPIASALDVPAAVKRLQQAEARLLEEGAGLVGGPGFKFLQIQLNAITTLMFKLQEASGLTVMEFDKLFDEDLNERAIKATALAEGFTDALRTAPEVIERAIKLTADWETELEAAGNLVRDLGEAWEKLFIDVQEGFEDTGAGIREWDIEDTTSQVRSFQEQVDDLAASLTAANLGMDLLVNAAGAMGNAISSGLEEGGLTLKSFLADMLRAVGHSLIAWGSLAIIMGIVTQDPFLIGAGAAALAAGAAAILIAKAIAPRGGRDEAGGARGGGGAAAAGATAGGQNVTFILQGPVFGGTEDQIIRQLMTAWRRQRGQNA